MVGSGVTPPPEVALPPCSPDCTFLFNDLADDSPLCAQRVKPWSRDVRNSCSPPDCDMCCFEKRATESPNQHSAPGADRMPMRGWGLASGIFRLRVWPLRLCGTHVAGSVAGDSLGAGPLFATDSPRLRKPCGALWSGGLFFLLQFMLSRFELP